MPPRRLSLLPVLLLLAATRRDGHSAAGNGAGRLCTAPLRDTSAARAAWLGCTVRGYCRTASRASNPDLTDAWGRDPVSWSGISNDDELAAGTFSQTPQGVIGGAHVGYNLQYNQWLVLGLEGSVDGTSLSHTFAVPVNDVFGDTPGSITARSEGDVQGSLRGRIGIAGKIRNGKARLDSRRQASTIR